MKTTTKIQLDDTTDFGGGLATDAVRRKRFLGERGRTGGGAIMTATIASLEITIARCKALRMLGATAK